MIFKGVRSERPYPELGYGADDWAALPPRQIKLSDLITTRTTLDLEHLLAVDSTFFGDLFSHVVRYRGDLYLEDGLHRAVRAALQGKPRIHARVLDLDLIAEREEERMSHLPSDAVHTAVQTEESAR